MAYSIDRHNTLDKQQPTRPSQNTFCGELNTYTRAQVNKVRELYNKLNTFKLNTELEGTDELYSNTCGLSTEPESLNSSTPTPGPR